MPEFFVQKLPTGKGNVLAPAHKTDEEAIDKFPMYEPLRVNVRRMRNVLHHRKYFALLNYAFDCWEPEQAEQFPYGKTPEKNFERFRSDITILAGFYEQYYRVDGSLRIEPKSISFASMDQDEFDLLYQRTIDVIIKHVLTQYTGDQLKQIVADIEEFES